MRKRKPKSPKRSAAVPGREPSSVTDPDDGYNWPRRTSGAKLVNNLTVDDARHMLKCEGGDLTLGQLIGRSLSIVIGMGLLAWAIAQGNVTVWHMVIPMVGHYVTLITLLPLLYVVLRHPGLRKDGLASLRLWGIITAVAAINLAVAAYRQERPWQAVAASSASASWHWVTEAQMQWPLLWSVVDAVLGLRLRVANLYQHGPPFVGVSLGCAMRFVVLLFGVVLVPFVAEGVSASPALWPWIVWGVIAVAEVLALAMHYDIQQRLRRLDASHNQATEGTDELPL